jgi:hypothetical protein
VAAVAAATFLQAAVVEPVDTLTLQMHTYLLAL